MSLISRSAGGSPPGKSISGLSMLTSNAPACLRKGEHAQSYILTASQLREDVHREDQGRVLLDAAALRRIVPVAQLRRDDDEDPAADLLAGQPLRPALDDLLQRERRQLAPAVRGVELLAAVPQHPLVLHQDAVLGADLLAVALDDVARHELLRGVRVRHLDGGGL